MVKRIFASGNIEGVEYDYLYNTSDFSYYFQYLDTYRPYELSYAGLLEFQDTGVETNESYEVSFIDIEGKTQKYVVLGSDYKNVWIYVSENLGKVINMSKSNLQITNI